MAVPCNQRMAASNTAAAQLLAALASIRAAPLLLRRRPASDPVREARIADIRSRGGTLSHAAVALARAALAMVRAAPCLLLDGPAQLPIREAVCAVVRISWRRRRSLLPADVMVRAAPRLLRRKPTGILTDCAVERISRGCWGRRRGRRQWPRRQWPRRCRGRRGRWCRRGGGRKGRWSRGLLRRRATHTGRGTAELLLLLRPVHLPIHACSAVVNHCGGHARHQPAEEGDQQQQAKEAARADQTSEVAPGPHGVEVATVAHILVGGLLDVFALTTAHIGYGTLPCTTTAADSASCDLLPACSTAGSTAGTTSCHETCTACGGPSGIPASILHACGTPLLGAEHHDGSSRPKNEAKKA